MKHFYLTLTFLLTTFVAIAQIPSGYYNSANGLIGFTLKTELRDITANGHTARTYDQLYDGSGVSGSQGYVDTHSDVNVSSGNVYENDGTVLDMYSENPLGTDPYNFTHNVDEGGNQNAEGDCYNREHLVPQSSFNSALPMQSDIHHVIPTDCRVNNYRGSFPFGNVGSVNLTSLNGSKRGTSSAAGYSGVVFEPIDEFKGDIARALLYFATRYENTINGYTSFDMFNGSNDQVFFPWAIDTLLDWHNNVDPVDQREIDRNNAAFNFQGNANPFVDHPEYADLIWNPNPDTQDPTTPTNLVASNPTASTVDLTWTASTDDTAVTSYDIYVDGVFYVNTSSNTTTFTVTGLSPETTYIFTILAKDAAGNTSNLSASDTATTLAGGATGTNCTNEDFENIPVNAGSYATRTWTGVDGIANGWTATDARTDQVLNTRSICIRNGTLTSPSISGGIGELTVTTQLTFGGSAGTFDVKVNGASVGSIPYTGDNTTSTTTTISNINLTGNVSVVLENQSASNRVRIDDLSWTCYSALSIEDFTLNTIKIYPNPVKGNLLNIEVEENTRFEIYSILGKKILEGNVTPANKQVSVSRLNKGVYILKLETPNGSISKKLVKD
ncbi:endonuclease [Lacinutrix sp. Bg11-31]|uniref:endonuclease n=1 Tax=Lacinutrix sp. Bg11-31 TaxID=2057808 RepID=UPI000C318141|nr:endonuclease [Lacinutrix sp. Bg11-31]AUC80980.1 endonuclease I [Lacinutrix sp. Bg11-31]